MNLPSTSRRVFLTRTATACAGLALAQTSRVAQAEPRAVDLAEVLKPILAESSLPALAGGAVKNGVIVGLGAVGIRRVGEPEKVTIKDKFHIGSDTKAMTATLAGMLVEQSRLKWTSTLAELFPERAPKMNAGFREVTMEQLLTHRAGLAHDGNYYGIPNSPVTQQRLAYLDAVLATPPPHPIDSYNYSNAGYIIAGAAMERISGKSWEELMRERLLGPLKMTETGFGTAAKEHQTDQPWGHVLVNGKFVPRYGDNHRALGPAGTVHCPIGDYLKFAAFHASRGMHPPGLLKPATFKKLHHPEKEDYAMGWAVLQRGWAKGAALTHAGSNTMNYFVVWLAPELDFGLAAATNAAGDKVPQALDQVAVALIKKFLL
jgi:CubicO group peptidase (beta-lactamase class C family)